MITIMNIVLIQGIFLCIQLGYKEIAVLLFICIFILMYYGLKKLKPVHFTFADEIINEFYGLLLV